MPLPAAPALDLSGLWALDRFRRWALARLYPEGEPQGDFELARPLNWQDLARPEQRLPPGDWQVWMILAGRGFGKTRTGAETVLAWVRDETCKRMALIADTEADARTVMIEGESGLLAICAEHERPRYEPSKRKLVFPNGAIATCYSADAYEQLRGPQFDGAWVDELAKFRYPEQVWDQLMLSLRLGDNPRAVVTTTPKPLKILKELVASPEVHITRGTTFDNTANLPTSFLKRVRNRFEGTRLGHQELYGEILSQTEGTLWTPDLLERYRIKDLPPLIRVVVAIDPATTSHDLSDETGIIVAGLGQDQCGYILEDHSGRVNPTEWARRAVKAYWHHKADRVVAEVNKGGDLVERVVRSMDANVSYKAVRATRGKYTRAEPIAALYEQGRVFHVTKGLDTLEQQMCSYAPGHSSKSPDRLDALVWALTELMLIHPSAQGGSSLGRLREACEG
jgi:predicted phage terminase large subunit-like protein